MARPRHILSTFARFARRRHRTVFATGATIIAILLAATAIAIWLAVHEARVNRISQRPIDEIVQPEGHPFDGGLPQRGAESRCGMRPRTISSHALSAVRREHDST